MPTKEMHVSCKKIEKHDKTDKAAAYCEFIFIGIGTSKGTKLSLQAESQDEYRIDDILAVEINMMVVPKQTKLGI
jgi:hypothetical protein